MARNQLLFSQKLSIIIFVGIIIVILSYLYDNLFLLSRLTDDNYERLQIILSDDANDIYNNDITSSKSKSIPCIPSLMIIGPPKSGTTSLVANLAYYFPNWFHQIPQKENTHFYNGIRENVVRNSSHLHVFYKRLRSHIEMIQNGHKIRISTFDFDTLLTDEIWPESSIMLAKSEFTERILRRVQNHIANDTYLIEKTAFHYYLLHLSLIFRKYFSSTQFSTGTWISDQWYSHTKKGSKILAILRDPTKRLISWHSMKIKFKQRKTMDHFIFNTSNMNSVVMEFRTLVMNRKDEYDDTLIMLKYIEWIYMKAEQKHRPWPNIWLSPDMLMFGVDFPPLLFWIYAYKQMGLDEYFKVVSFNYMVRHFKEVMLRIRCWVEDDITDLLQCKNYQDTNESIVLQHMNAYSATRVKDEYELQLMQYMDEFYKPFKRQTSLLVQRTNIALGVWDESSAITSW